MTVMLCVQHGYGILLMHVYIVLQMFLRMGLVWSVAVYMRCMFCIALGRCIGRGYIMGRMHEGG